MSALGTTIVTRAESARRRKLVAVTEVSRDWQPRGHRCWVMVNEKDDIPANFVLRLEEIRKVRDIGGGEVTEIRRRSHGGS